VTPLRLEAPAKLNLSLAVVGRRSDGLHELVSELVLLELADRLLLMPGCSGLRVEAPATEQVPPDRATNLAWRGLVAGLGGEPELACLTLDKQVPAAAGLGGGSSDAAAAWRLGRAWRGADDRASDAELEGLAAALGADVPFFAARHPAARVEGIGERVTPLPPRTGSVVLVHPPYRLSTAAVFAELRPSEWSGVDREPGGNDLLAAATRLRPEIDDLFRLVLSAGATPRLTGSGPTVFALDDDTERLEAVAGRLARAGLRVAVTRTRTQAASIEPVSDEQEEDSPA
jgi:4-diphosphocytidyl-2-C-methyl-D-erythritol kinase